MQNSAYIHHEEFCHDIINCIKFWVTDRVQPNSRFHGHNILCEIEH